MASVSIGWSASFQERDVLQFGNLIFLVTALDDPAGRGERIGASPQDEKVHHFSWEETLEQLALEVTRQTLPSLEEQYRQWIRLSPADQAAMVRRVQLRLPDAGEER